MKEQLRTQIYWAIFGCCVGTITGIFATIFGCVLLWITDIRMQHIFLLVPFLPLAGVFVVWLYETYGGRSKEGIGLIFSAGYGEDVQIPRRLIPFIIIGTWLTHLFGGSAGREGVAVQIGATISHRLGRVFSLEHEKTILICTGMAAGFSGLFQTPIAAICFAAEVLIVGKLQYRAIIPMCTGAYSACTISHFLGLEKFTVPLSIPFSTVFLLQSVLLGLIFGLVGTIFAYGLRFTKIHIKRIFPKPMMRVFICSILLACILLGLQQGRYTGLGTNLIHSAFLGEEIFVYDWFLKSILTIFTLSIGFQGGEVTPLFSIGACLGIVLASILDAPVYLVAALGYATVFGAATNTIFAPICIGVEVFGFANIPYFVVCCMCAHIFCRYTGIYEKQKHHHFIPERNQTI